MEKDYSRYYSQLLYSLLPEIYQKKDFDKKELECFLRIIGDQAGVMRQNMDDLWYDFFIETCHDWAVPYIGDLLGTNLVFNDAARNRVDVKNTIPWRRRKGTLNGLEDVAEGITGWGAHVVEFFDLLIWSQHMNHIKPDKPCTFDLKDIYSLEKLNSAFDTALHTADIKKTSQQQGWYGIKNIGFFLYTKQMYRLDHTNPEKASAGSGRYTFSSTGKNVALFDLETRGAIKPFDFKRNHDEYFGSDRGMGIYCEGVLVAISKPLPPLPVRSQTNCTFGELHEKKGMQLMDWSYNNGDFIIEAIEAEWNEESDISINFLGTFLTSSKGYSKGIPGTAQGTFMIKISSENGTAAFFPGAILALRGVENGEEMTAKNTIESVYNNTLYVYLPEAFLETRGELYLLVDEVGATYYHNGSSELSVKNIARASEGQVYPPRGLSSSFSPLKLDSINKEKGIILFDRKRFGNKHFTITCCSVDFIPAELSFSIIELGSLEINGPDTDEEIKYTYIATNPGEGLALKIKSWNGQRFPQSEIVLKDSRGRSTLVYLPETYFDNIEGEVYLYPADDGSTYYTNTNAGHTGKPELKPDIGGAMRISNIARKSAGQVLPIPDVFPLQQRRVKYSNLSTWKNPDSGFVAIDPVAGRFSFPKLNVPEGEILDMPEGEITVKYNEAFTHDIGARTYDRRAALLQKPVIKVRGSDISDGDTYKTISEAINNAPENGIIQIEDSHTYRESSPFKINKSLTLQAANFQRPTIILDRIEVEGNVEELKLDGILFTAGIKVKTPIDKLIISNCTFDPDNTGLEIPVNDNAPDSVSIGSIEIMNSIIGNIACTNVGNIKITDSIVHNKNSYLFSWDEVSDTERAPGKGKYKLIDHLRKKFELDWLDPVYTIVRKNTYDTEGKNKGLQKLLLKGPFTWPPFDQDRIIITLNNEETAASSAGLTIFNDKREDELIVKLEKDKLNIYKKGIAICGSKGEDNSNAVLTVERSTILGSCKVQELYSSDSIFLGTIDVINTQDGCIRYCRYQKKGSKIPAVFRSTEDVPQFNSLSFWRYDYCELAANCSENIRTKSDKGSEMGVFSSALNPIRENNLKIKLQEYMPAGLKPVIIYEL